MWAWITMVVFRRAFRNMLQSGIATWFDSAVVGSNIHCLGNETAEPWRCFFAQYLSAYIETPIFVVNRCVPHIVEVVDQHRPHPLPPLSLQHVTSDHFCHSMYDPANLGDVLQLRCSHNLTLCDATQLLQAQAYHDLYLSVLQRDLLSRGTKDGLFATACNEHEHMCRQEDFEHMQV
jgi:hypothetical protein